MSIRKIVINTADVKALIKAGNYGDHLVIEHGYVARFTERQLSNHRKDPKVFAVHSMIDMDDAELVERIGDPPAKRGRKPADKPAGS